MSVRILRSVKSVIGGMDSDTPGEIDENFDPHEHREIVKPTTYSETMMHLLKGSLGAGLLAMPNAVSRLGMVYGCLGIIIIGIFATYCVQLLIMTQYEICKIHKRGYMAYQKSMKVALENGPECLRPTAVFLSSSVDTVLFIWQIGICAIYFVFVSENIKQILDHYGYIISVRMLICYMYPILLALSLIKDLKILAPFSTFSNFCVVLGLILVFFYLVHDDVVVNEDKFSFTGLENIPIFIGITLFALEAVGVVLALEYNMEHPKQFTGFFGLFSIAMYIIIFTYTLLGLCGYLKYGKDCKGSVTLNLPQHEK